MKLFLSSCFLALALGGCCTSTDNKVDALQKNLVELQQVVEQTTAAVTELTARVGELSGKIDNLEKRVAVLEENGKGKEKK